MDNNGHITEREQELINWILVLIDIINRYSIFFGLINRDVNWLDSIWENDSIKEKQGNLLDVLREKYGINLQAITNEEYLDD